ncbi:MAG TPA: lysylphosphatidylglycerol synthase domain-containing protein [Vicinamibacteria bacterium]|nr:lysylphosphatidylglycerol synthase domain-containing protein [Vicinamibacteria bacterium]
MKRLLHHVAQLLPALVSLALLAWVLRSADLGRALGLVRSLGWRLPLLLLPNLFAGLAETAGWWVSFARFGGRPSFPRLFAVRVMVDALMLGLPSGSVVSETVQPYLLKRRCDVPLETGIVATVARKFFVVVSHGLFLALATVLAWPLLDQDSAATIGRQGLPWLLLLTSFVLVGAAVAGVLATAHGRVADRLRRGLDRIGGRWLGSWLERNATRFQRTDEGLTAFFARKRMGLVPSIAVYEIAWLVRSVETWAFLRLVGVEITLPAAMVIETALILVRAMAVPVPAGLGVQDAGYVLCLRGLAVPDATTVGAAFVVLKRGKDLCWILLGFLLLGVGRRPGEGALAPISEGGPAEPC